MSNPTPPPYPRRSPAPGSPAVPARPVVGQAPVVYRYTQKFRQEWLAGAPLATWGPRVVALLVDFLVVSVPFNLVIDFVSGFLPEGLPQLPLSRDLLLWLVFGLATSLTANRVGASLGKKLMNLQVAPQLYSRRPLIQSFLRETLVCYMLVSFYQVINFLMLSGLGFLFNYNLLYLPGFILGLGCWPLFLNPPRLPLHDRFFKTKVVIADTQKI
jgi:uncharacterized RDD family membrane protein YckC